MKKVTQVLYSGLGGHGSVAFSIFHGDKYRQVFHQMVFFGVEELRDEYREKCISEQIPFEAIIISRMGKVKALWKAFRAIQKQQPDVVILHSIVLFPLVPLLKLLGIYVISVDHTPNATKTGNEWRAVRFLNQYANRQVFLTKDQFQDNIERFGPDFYKNAHPVIINNGIDIQKYAPSVETKKDSSYFKIFMQARFSKTKDFQTLVQAFAFVKNQSSQAMRLFLAGDGETWKECVELAMSLGVENEVTFLGMIHESEIVEHLRSTHLYVHSSLSETMSTAIMQALAVGVPCLVSDIPGNQALIKEGENGYLFSTKDAVDLANKILSLSTNENELQRMSQNSRQFAVNHLSMEAMFEKYYQLFK